MRLSIVAIFLAFPAVIAECPAGSTATASAADTTCRNNAASCAGTSSCCTQDPTSCKATSLNCPTGQFKDSAKNGATAGTTDTDKQTNCCTAKATCSAYTCPAGSTATASAADTACRNNAASCAGTSSCCTQDPTSCKATSLNCPTGQFKDSAKNGATAGTTDTDKQTNCCTAKATCSAYTLPATASPSKSPTLVPTKAGETLVSTKQPVFGEQGQQGQQGWSEDMHPSKCKTTIGWAGPKQGCTVGSYLGMIHECKGDFTRFHKNATISYKGSCVKGEMMPGYCECPCKDRTDHIEDRASACSGTAFSPTLPMMLVASTAAILGQLL